MRRAWFPFLLTLGLLPGRTVGAAGISLEEFQAKMEKQLARLSPKTTAAVRVELLGSGRLLFSRNEGEKMIPASDAKLVTSAAALQKLGPAFTFSTSVFREGDDLILAGNGDPYLVSERLWLLARDVARSGIKKVSAIRVNNAAYAENYLGLTEFQDSGEPFTAIASPTGLNFNSVEVHVIPDPSARRPRLETGPVSNGYAILQNEVSQTGGAGKNVAVRPVRVEGGREVFAVTGSVGRQAEPVVVYAAVSQPEAHIAWAFAALLRREGIEVVQDFGGVSRAPVAAGRRALASIPSLPLRELVALYNTFSNNFMAEQVFHALGTVKGGGPLSPAKSRQVEADFLRQLPACADAVLENGSGLSWDTRITARCLADIMQFAYRDFQVFTDLMSSLPVGGETGTLKHRFQRAGGGFTPAKVRAKTGTLWSRRVVTSLTGVTATANGEKALFVLMENDQRKDPGLLRELKDWEDRCVELMQQLEL